MLIRNIFLFVFAACLLASCSKDELAFDVIESPVLAQFETMTPSSPDMVKVKATFMDLDKSGILDHTVGIDSLPVAGLSVKVFVYETELVGEYMTDSAGEVVLEENLEALQGAGKLEWVGEYEETPFRIYSNY